ncbi:MAG: amino acid adenylation domain-containing protein, partial [Archangium sp.]
KGEALETQLSYWRQQLAQAPKMLELPTDRPRPPVQSHRGAQLPFLLPATLSRAVHALSQREGATPFMVLLAGFQALLSRYSGQQDISVGTPIAGRTHAGTEGLIGFFVNTLVLRTRLEGNPSFRELLGRVRQVALGAYAHQDIPFEKLVEELKPERSLSYSPLFQVMLALRQDPLPDLALPGITTARELAVDTLTSKFDLTLSLVDTAQGFTGSLEYNTDLFDAGTAARMLGHLQVLLEAATANPELPLSALSLLSEAERQQVLVEWNDTRADFPRDTCVHTLVEAQALRAPDALAVQLGQESLTYRQLDARANQLAHHLHSLGVRRGALVGLCLPRSPDMVVALLAILKAGAAYVPLDPSYPLERLSFMLRDAGISVLLTRTDIADKLPSQGEQRFRMDTDWDSLASHPAQAPDSSTTADDIAYVIYTSGSTGLPKGVQIPHRGLMNLVSWHQRTYSLTPSDRATLLAGVAFDASVWELWPYLSAGASLLLPSEDVRSTPSELVLWLASQQITLSFLPTPLAEAVLQEPWPQDMALRVLLTGGDRLSRRPPRALRTLLVNHYGPTESTVVTSCDRVAPQGQEPGLPPIGRPISNTRVYLLDGHLQPVGLGVPGELYIGGDGLAVGYLRRPELTSERFLPDPFSQEPGARLYRTGDRARYLPDGRLEYLERVDFQVKVRGFRIELGEIEEALVRQPTVKQAVVVMREDVPGDKRLVAYAVPQPGLKLDVLELRQYLQGKLPEYMVPSAFVSLESLPLTPNGKVDRKALPAPDGQLAVREHSFVAPRTPTEETLVNVWKQVLNVERVGIHDNFFELGGHSLLATQAASRIRASFGVELPLRSLFEAPTVEALASRIDAASREEQELKRPPLGPVARTGGELPLSFAQQRLWFLEQLEPGLPIYNVAGAVQLEGTLDASALERGFQELVRRHESLRTTFRSTEKEPVQVIHPEASLPLPVIDLGELPQADQEAEVRRLAREEAGRPFELIHGPLLRVKLLKLGETRHVLLLTMHHIVSDGWSMGILIREVGALYQAFSSGQPSPLPELLVQYADYAAWQRQWLRDEALEAQL